MRDDVITEADTCRKFITPRPIEAGWSVVPHAIGEQHAFTHGRIIEIDYTRGTERDRRNKPITIKVKR